MRHLSSTPMRALVPLLVLALSLGRLSAFPNEGVFHSDGQVGAVVSHSGYNLNPPPAPTHSQVQSGYNYEPSSDTSSSSESENEWTGEWDKNWQVKDEDNGVDFGQDETAKNGAVDGTYYVLLPDGRKQTVTYHVDKDSGYTASVAYEQGPVPPQPAAPSNLYETPAAPPSSPTAPVAPSKLYETPSSPPAPVTPSKLYETPAPPSPSYVLPSTTSSPPHSLYDAPQVNPQESGAPSLDLRSHFGR